MAKTIKKHSSKAIALALVISITAFYGFLVDTTQATQVSTRSDTMNNSSYIDQEDLSTVTSNHTIVFTVQDAVQTTAGPVSSTITIAIDAETQLFDLSTIECDDIDIQTTAADTATSISSNGNGGSRSTRTNCPGSATSWGVRIDAGADVITFYTPTGVGVYIPAGTQVKIKIGQHATDQETGNDAIINPATGGSKIIRIGGTFGGSGDMYVAIVGGVQVSATIGETLTFTIEGLPGIVYSGTDDMAGCTTDVLPTPYLDDDDNQEILTVTTTATSVPFSTITVATMYQGCQRLGIQTNAAGGYTISQREDHPLRTAGGTILADTTCNSAATCPNNLDDGLWTNAGGGSGFGVSCKNSSTSVSCSSSAPNYGAGDQWVPFGAESLGFTTSTRFSSVSSATSALVLLKAKYRLKAPSSQASGTYTNNISWIATPTF